MIEISGAEVILLRSPACRKDHQPSHNKLLQLLLAFILTDKNIYSKDDLPLSHDRRIYPL